MRHRRSVSVFGAGLGLAFVLGVALRVAASVYALPASLSDREFWTLTEALSEPNGYFHSDNLVSNEVNLSTVAAALAARVKPGGVYLGVGPEQNFTYIAVIRPKIAFINDIRRGNLHLHLMYKALFELSANRSEFVSRLFTKPLQRGPATASTANELISAYWDVSTSDEATYQVNLQAIKDVLVKKHGLPLPAEDLAGIEYVYRQFYLYGPAISYSSTRTRQEGGASTYRDLMITTDTASGAERSFLSTEDNFLFLKGLESTNLIVPTVGDFAGPKALRAIGAWVRNHSAVVTAFYVSNVESYLARNGVWPAFCVNVAAMPLDGESSFIRPSGGDAIQFLVHNRTVPHTFYVTTAVAERGGWPFGSMVAEVKECNGK
jgi:hypothetical protein